MGRHPACCLILRIPIPRRTSLYPQSDAVLRDHRGLIRLSPGCPRPWGRLDTRYSPVRRSPAKLASKLPAAPRLACVKPVASVHPEPGSNSPLYNLVYSDPTPNRGPEVLSLNRTPRASYLRFLPSRFRNQRPASTSNTQGVDETPPWHGLHLQGRLPPEAVPLLVLLLCLM